MTAIRSLEDLNKFREEVLEKKAQDTRLGKIQMIVSLGSCGIAAGALDTMSAIQEHVASGHLDNVMVSKTGCSGLCEKEPIVLVIAGNKSKVTYGKVTPEVVERIVKEHILGGKVVQDYVIEA